jgi:hypothetical protein
MELTPDQEHSLKVITDSLYLVHREVLEAEFVAMVRSNMELTNRLNDSCESQIAVLGLLMEELVEEGF